MTEDDKKLKFKVFVRLRPVPTDSGQGSDGVCKIEHRIIRVQDVARSTASEFVFDRVWGADAQQQSVFSEMVQPLVEHTMQGYNACCFAYGQTGSGKTYTMFGQEGEDESHQGMIPRAVEQLFQAVAAAGQNSSVQYTVFVSFLEIYLEQVRDLGRAALLVGEAAGGRVARKDLEDWGRSNLDVMEDSGGHTSVKDLTYIEAKDMNHVLKILRDGASLRTTAATALNDVSSRSHTVFTISVIQQRDNKTRPITGRLHLVDLAGSERQSKTNSEGLRLAEAKAINKSLTALGKVVLALSTEGLEKGHVPFRDTKLTRILKDSLQGNSLTSMLATLNPLPDNAEECFNTLQFAVRCQNIDLAPQVNVDDRSVTGLHRASLAGDGRGGGDDDLLTQVAALQEELEFTHAHYQKLLESVAGPDWIADMGPVDRMTMNGEALGGSSMDGSVFNASDNRASARRRSSSGRVGLFGGITDPRVRRLEMQVDAARATQKEMEELLARKKRELEDMRDRIQGNNTAQLVEIKKLRLQVSELTAKLAEQRAESQHHVEYISRRQEDEIRRLSRDNEMLRKQLQQVHDKVVSAVELKGVQSSNIAKTKQFYHEEAERRVSEQAAAITVEKERQVEAIRQQTEAQLRHRDEQLASLQAQLNTMRKSSSDEVTALKSECEHLAAYAESVTLLLQQTGTSRPKSAVNSGIKGFKLPPRDQSPSLDSSRLRYLSTLGKTAARLLEASTSVNGIGTKCQNKQITGNATTHTADDNMLNQQGRLRDSPRHTQSSPRQQEQEGNGYDKLNSTAYLGDELRALQLQSEEGMEVSMAEQGRSDQGSREHMRALELELAKTREELLKERRKTADMQVALRSTQRSMSRTDSPLNQAIQGLTQVDSIKWGFGHNGGLHTRTSRPVSASPRLMSTSKAGSLAATNVTNVASRNGLITTAPRPGTATAMQYLTSSFRDNGLPC